MVERVTGRGLPEFLDERLFKPMGVDHAAWDRLKSGAAFGFHGLHLTTEAIAVFGELLLRGGLCGDQQLLPREWVELATRRHIDCVPLKEGADDADFRCRLPLPGSADPGRSASATLDASAEGSALPDGTTVIIDPIDGGWLVRFASLLDVDVGHGDWREIPRSADLSTRPVPGRAAHSSPISTSSPPRTAFSWSSTPRRRPRRRHGAPCP